MRVLVSLSLLMAFPIVVASTAFSQEEAIAEAVASPTTDARPSVRPLTVAAGLTDDSTITGTLTDSTSLAIKTAFGEASIPLSEVAGIRFPAADDTSTTVVMLNGDSITGATDLKFVNVETTWGSAKINGQSIATMLFVPGLAWQNVESLGGKRWNLVEATLPQRANNPVQQASGVRNPTVQPGQPQVIYGR